MNTYPTGKSLTQELIDSNNNLTGLYFTIEDLDIDDVIIFKESYVYLNDSKIHNPDGPAIITKHKAGNYSFNYFLDNQPHASNKPFRALGYSYPNHPSMVGMEDPPNFINGQFTYTKISWYEFENNLGHRHSEFGPAKVDYLSDKIYAGYFLSGEEYTLDEYGIEIKKMAVLKIIQES